MKSLTRTGALLVALLCLAVGHAQAQAWPNKPVRIIAPFAPGGAADTLGRLIAEQLTTTFKQQFFVENRGGAGGIVGALAGAQAEPDGYTLVVSSIASNVISPVFNSNVGYDGIKDFTHIAYLGGPPSTMIVHPKLGVKTYQEFVASRARARILSPTFRPAPARTAFWSLNTSRSSEDTSSATFPIRAPVPRSPT